MIAPEPMLPLYAHLAAFAYASVYVGSLYISKNTRLSFTSNSSNVGIPGPEQGRRLRNDPDVIKARLLAVSIASALCCYAFVAHIAPDDAWSRLGLTNVINMNPLSYLVTPALFIGPLYGQYLGESLPFQRYGSGPLAILGSWQGIRNFFLAPITEEVVFRSCVVATYALTPISQTKIIFLSPLSFGLAHVHHAWEEYNINGRTSQALKRAVFTSLFQLGYTTLFGIHATFLFVRTQSIYPSILAHIFCNIMGVPNLGWELKVYKHRKIALWATYLGGIVAFGLTLGPWTRS